MGPIETFDPWRHRSCPGRRIARAPGHRHDLVHRPSYGVLSNLEACRAQSELRQHFVSRFDPHDGMLDVVSNFLFDPKGLGLLAEEPVLCVPDTSAERFPERGFHHVVALDRQSGRTLAKPRVSRPVQRLLGRCTRLAHIPVPERVGNLTFGGAARDELFICASTSLYRLRLNAQGIRTP